MLIELVGSAINFDPQISLLSSSQLALWKPYIEFSPLEPNAMVSSLTKPVSPNPMAFTAKLNSTNPEAYFLVVSFGGSIPDSDFARSVGKLHVEWEQADGKFLQYQLWKLPHALSVSFNLVLANVCG